MKIPILAIPVLNRGDMLLRCIRSIDFPIEKLVLVNNGDDQSVAAAIEQLEGESDFNIRSYKPPFNLGCGPSWNWIIKNNPAPYWLLVGNDIEFTPGDLQKIAEFVDAHPDYVIMPANWGHSLFAVTPACIERVGWFDPNFYPAYCEDQDQMYRIKLADAPWQDVPDVHAIHGEPPLWGSTTVWSDPVLNKLCAKTQANNHRYYEIKWGGQPGKEKFTHPYNDESLSLKEWRIDEDLAKSNENPLFTKDAKPLS